MKLLFASDSFKGSLSSEKTVELLSRAAREVFGACETAGVPVADGGEGTVDAVIAAEKGEKVFARVHGPLSGQTVEAGYGILPGGRAVIEMAAASGLPLVPQTQRGDAGDAKGTGNGHVPLPLQEALDNAEALYYEGAVRMFRLIRVGVQIAAKGR